MNDTVTDETTEEDQKETDSQAVKRLIAGIDWSKTPDEVLEYLKWSAAFTDYSTFNKMLIRAQMPTATRVGAAGKWFKLGRKIIKGETHCIRVYRPIRKRMYLSADDDAAKFTNVRTSTDKDGKEVRYIEWTQYSSTAVFDISQTEPREEGEGDLPDLVPDFLDGAELTDNIQVLMDTCDEILLKMFNSKMEFGIHDPLSEFQKFEGETDQEMVIRLHQLQPIRMAFDRIHLVADELYSLYQNKNYDLQWSSTLLGAVMIAYQDDWDVSEMTRNIMMAHAADSNGQADLDHQLSGSNALDVIKAAEWIKEAFISAKGGVPREWIM